MVLDHLFTTFWIQLLRSVRFLSLVLLASLSLPAQGVGQGTGRDAASAVEQVRKSQSVSSLDPHQWSSEELARYIELQTRGTYDMSIAKFSEGQHRVMIGGATEPLAVHAGLKALQAGGSAADAVVTAALAQIALSAGADYSYAGIMDAVYFEAKTGKVYALNGGYNTVKGELEPLTIPGPPTPSGRTALVPGFMGGLGALHQRFGKLAWADLLKPSIWIAEEGVPVNTVVLKRMTDFKQVLMRLPETKSIFFKADGTPYGLGETFRQPALADTLKKLAAQGSQYMYTGDWGRHFVTAVQREGGKISNEDMAAYRADWVEPLRVKYRDYELVSLGNSHPGAIQLLGSMKAAEVANLHQYGHYTRSPETLFYLIQINKAYRALTFMPPEQRAREFPEISPALEQQITPETARQVLELIRANRLPDKSVDSRESHTSVVVAVDERGNAACIVHSINTIAWGTTGLFVDGVSIPDSGRFLQKGIARLTPGARFPDGMVPLAVMKDGKLSLITGAIGDGPLVMLYTLFSMLDSGMDVIAANAQPFPLGPRGPLAAPNASIPENILPDSFNSLVLQRLKELGQPVEIVNRGPGGFWVALEINPRDKDVNGAATFGVPSLFEGF